MTKSKSKVTTYTFRKDMLKSQIKRSKSAEGTRKGRKPIRKKTDRGSFIDFNFVVKEIHGDIISLSIVPESNENNGLTKSLLVDQWCTSVNDNQHYEVMSSPEFQFKSDDRLEINNESKRQTAKFWEQTLKTSKNSKSKQIKKHKINKGNKIKEHKIN